MYVVEVTWGTRRYQCFARAASYEDARRLREAAVERGYTDAKIVLAADFDAAAQERARGAADPGRPPRRPPR